MANKLEQLRADLAAIQKASYVHRRSSEFYFYVNKEIACLQTKIRELEVETNQPGEETLEINKPYKLPFGTHEFVVLVDAGNGNLKFIKYGAQNVR